MGGPDFSGTQTEGALGPKASWKVKWFGEEPQHQAALPLPVGEHLLTELVSLPQAPCPASQALDAGSKLPVGLDLLPPHVLISRRVQADGL